MALHLVVSGNYVAKFVGCFFIMGNYAKLGKQNEKTVNCII